MTHYTSKTDMEIFLCYSLGQKIFKYYQQTNNISDINRLFVGWVIYNFYVNDLYHQHKIMLIYLIYLLHLSIIFYIIRSNCSEEINLFIPLN